MRFRSSDSSTRDFEYHLSEHVAANGSVGTDIRPMESVATGLDEFLEHAHFPYAGVTRTSSPTPASVSAAALPPLIAIAQ
jgi:hypothetical protein